MTAMLERAAGAAALANEDEGCFDAVSAYTPIARAVLMAVRDLDDETRQRGSEIYCTKGSGLFTAMIDAILNEPQEQTND